MISTAIAITIVLLDLILGFIVLFRGKGREVNVVFFFLTFFVALWVGSNTVVDAISSQYVSLLATRSTFFSTSWAMFFLLYFALIFTRKHKSHKTKIVLWMYFFVTIFLSSLSFTGLIIENVRLESWGGYSSVHGPLINLHLFFLIITSIWSIGVLIYIQNKAAGVEKLQIRYILVGLGLAVFSAITRRRRTPRSARAFQA